MADDLTYSGTGASPPANIKQVTDEHVTRGHMPVVKLGQSADGSADLVPADVNGLLVKQTSAPLPVDAATQTTLNLVLAKLIAAPATEAKQDTLNAKDFATQTTLAAVLAKLSSDPATQTTLAAILAKQPTTPALDGTDITTPTAMPAGGVGIRGWLSAIWTKLNGTIAVTGTFWQATQPISGMVTANAGTNLNTSALALEAGNLAAILAKLSADPATQTTLAAVLAKIIAAPATEAKQDTLIAKDFATQTTLALVKAKTDNIPALGQAVAAASVPVVLPATQITTLTPPAAITNYANETGGNLAAIKTDVDKIPSQGQALAAASMPVVLTAAQVSTLTPPAAITGFATETTLAAVLAKQPSTPALDGTDITTPTAMPAGGVGIRGWLSAIWTKLNGSLAVTGTFWQATQPVSGTFWQATQPVSEADGANVTLGAKADAKNTATDTTAISAMSVWKQISASVQAIVTALAGTLTVATHAVTQSGTWTVQPGNTANTTAWKVDGSAVYTTWANGELAGNTSATQMPSQACKWVIFKAEYDNAGSIYIGISGVTKADGTTDTTTGIQLRAGESTPQLEADNLNRFYRISDNAGDDLTYLAAVS